MSNADGLKGVDKNFRPITLETAKVFIFILDNDYVVSVKLNKITFNY